MNKEIHKDHALRHIFNLHRETALPEGLNVQIMKKVYRIQKRREIRNLFFVGFTSLTLLSAVILVLKYYLKFDFSILLLELTESPANFTFPFKPILFISIIVCCLLWIDNRLRKKWQRP